MEPDSDLTLQFVNNKDPDLKFRTASGLIKHALETFCEHKSTALGHA